jgi:MFS family permease
MTSAAAQPDTTSPTPHDGHPALASRWRWILALVAASILAEQTALSFTLIYPSVPFISGTYKTTNVVWVFTVYTLVGGVTAPLICKLGDKFGKRLLLLLAAVVCTAGLLISATSDSFAVMIIGRAVASTSTVFIPLTYSLIADVFPRKRQPLSIAIITNGLGITTILGPFIAGWLLDSYGFRAVFWGLVVLTAVGGVGVLLTMPETPVRVSKSFDLAGAVLLGAAAFGLLLGLSEGQRWGWSSAGVVGCFAGGAAALLLWTRWELGRSEPLIDLRLLVGRPLGTTVLAGAIVSGGSIVAATFTPYLAETPRIVGVSYGYGLSPTHWAVWLIPNGLGIVLIGVVVGLTARRTGYRAWMIWSGLAMAVSMALTPLVFTSEAPFIILVALMGTSTAFYAAVPGLLLAAVPDDERAIAAGIAGTAQSLGNVVVTSVAGAIMAANVGRVIDGTPIYSGHGFTVLFLTGAGIGVLGALTSLLIPHSGIVRGRQAPAGAQVITSEVA